METTITVKKISSDKVANFLKENEKIYLGQWEEQVLISKQTSEEKEKVKMNGYLMYQLVIETLNRGIGDEDLKILAYKVAQERVGANINIGDFVYNVNLGRSIIIKYVNQSGVFLEDLQPIIDLINKHFDKFCYYAVTKYTELKDIELQEKKLFIDQTHKDRLAILGQMSSSFVHEFRNPLTSVIGFVKLLMSDYPDLPYLNIINEELKQLNFRITQFLHTSKIDSVVEIETEELSIKEVLLEIIEFLYPSIVDGNIQISTKLDIDITIMGNRNELKQVFLNIIMNSIDAVRENMEKSKSISVSLFCKEEITVEISNNGAPIPNEHKQIIFEPFYTTKQLGTGIGLFVCKNIVDRHRGKIWCTSDDKVTTFCISLPIK